MRKHSKGEDGKTIRSGRRQILIHKNKKYNVKEQEERRAKGATKEKKEKSKKKQTETRIGREVTRGKKKIMAKGEMEEKRDVE